MNQKVKLFLVLWIAGLLGVLTLLSIDLSAQLSAIMPADAPLPPDTLQFRLLTLIQPTVLLAVATLIGVWLAPKVNLFAPAAQALVNGKSVANALRPQLLPGIISGLVGGLALALLSQQWLPYLPPEFVTASENMTQSVLARFLYGGITEEILMRWGFMTLLVWIPYRLFAQRAEQVPTSFYIAAIIIAAIIFGIGHLPIAFILAPSLTLSLIAYVITLNTLFGLIAGYLFWRFGLEAAIIAHIFVHVALLIAERIAT